MDYAFQVFEGMEAHGYIPSVIAFNTLIKGIWNRLSTSCRLEQTCEHGISLATRDGYSDDLCHFMHEMRGKHV
jgi:hypothetical protein